MQSTGRQNTNQNDRQDASLDADRGAGQDGKQQRVGRNTEKEAEGDINQDAGRNTNDNVGKEACQDAGRDVGQRDTDQGVNPVAGLQADKQTGAWASRMPALQHAIERQLERLGGDIRGRLEAQAYLNDSDARYHGEVIGMGLLPKLYDEDALRAFDRIVTTTYAILEKMTRRFIEDADYRALFRFSPLLERLILLPDTYECAIPIGRFDIFLNEDDGSFMFCEFNTDGTSAMNEDREVSNALALTATLNEFSSRHHVDAQELFDPWVEEFMRIYEDSSISVLDPVVAIVDYMDSAIVDEQLEFRRRFAHYGVNCLVVDVSTLEYVDGKLYGRDVSKQHPAHLMPTQIDAVYRRAVTHELLRELEGSGEKAERLLSPEPRATTNEARPVSHKALRGAFALLAAVFDKSACMIGGFKTQVAHSKACFCLLHHPRTLAFLTEDEGAFIREHVPRTTWLKPDCIDIERVKRERENWIIKPVDGYASQGVQAGSSLDAKEWGLLIDEKAEEDYIVQEYCPQFQTLNTLPVPPDDSGRLLFTNNIGARKLEDQGVFDPVGLTPYNILTGLYCYGGRFSGIYVRSGPDAVIVGSRGGITLASLLIDYVPPPGLAIRPRAIME